MKNEKYIKNVYNKFGKEYHKTREEKSASRLYNDYLEVPEMLKAVGNIKNKKLLDVGCGSGIHIKKYEKKGAKCFGVDISQTMIDIAKEKNPNIEFKVGTMIDLPYKNNSFDVVTMSLAVHYINDWTKIFKEVNRVLKKDGLFYYSTESPMSIARERFEDKDIKFYGIGRVKNKKTNEEIFLGQPWKEGLFEWDMLPGMKMKTYRKTFRTQLKHIRESNFELFDYIDCKPIPAFKKYDATSYEVFTRFPLFSIYVLKKK